MSSQHQYNMAGGGPSGSRAGDIEHIGHLSEHIGQLCLSQEYSDVTLVVEGYHIHAHKVILAARSEYFRALLFGGMREMNQAEVELQGAPLHAFKALLRYVYSGHLALSCLREETVLDTLGLAHQFGFQELETVISDYLRQVLALRNVCAVLDSAKLYGLEGLTKVCHNFLDNHASDILKHESFLLLSVEALQELLGRDSFFVPEVEIFNAICNWCNNYIKNNGNQDNADTVLRCVRLPLMSLEELLTVVRPFSLVTPDMLLDAIQEKTHTNNTKLKHRGQLLSEENVATLKRGSSVIQGEMRAALLDGDTHNYDMERGYTRHAILDTTENNGILVKLGVQSIINHIKILLWDRDLRSYAYYIEVSVDQKDWVRVIDHSIYFCRSWQHLYFEPRVVQYIKLVGTNNTVNKVFHAVSLEASHTQKVPPLYKGLVRPTKNVATLELSATVVEGVSRSRNALLNGDIQHYDWEYGYTCHQLGSGAILVQLAQPFVIGSIKMLLWDCDDRSYSYYVETAINYWDWEVVADKTHDSCRSWQILHFKPRPIVLIKIVGTNNTANEVFHLVHFECPAQEDNQAVQSNSTVKSPQVIASTGQVTPPSSGVITTIAVPEVSVPTGDVVPSEARSDASSSSSAAPTPPPALIPPTETALEAHERYID